jgi:ABC-2 type transport system permease protein
LAPLVPTIRDMIQEYDIAAGGKIAAEVVDPRDDPELEEEANQVYGIQPVPFRISGRYEDSIINSYFDILIRYGDQSVVLGFQDLIEIETVGNQQVNVRLRNLEYDLTRSIKKVVEGFQSLDTVFASLDAPVKLTAIVTPASLPQSFSQAPEIIDAVAQEMVEEADGQFVFETIDPSDPNAGLSQQELFDTYGIQPFAVSLFSPDTYYLHLVLEIDNQPQVLYPSGSMSEAELRTEIEAALRREAPGFLKTVGLWHPSEDPVPNPYGGGASQPLSTWQGVRTQLEQDYAIELVDLTSGRVPGNVDALVVIAPQGMTDRQRFAIDQYLMRGGAVIVASGAFMLSPQQFGAGITIQPVQEGLAEMLASYGVTIEDALVMDPQNEPFPIPVQRDLGGVSVVEIQQISYPFFVDVRPPGMAKESAIVANLPAVTLQWVSPLGLDSEANAEREATILMESTSASWLRTDPNVNPDLQSYPEFGFPVEGEQMSHPLAVSVVGSFDSYFQDRPSPLEQGEGGEGPPAPDEGGSDTPAAVGTIDASPDSSRLVVIGSAEFVDDVVLEISRSQSQDRYRNNLQLLQQAVDWAVEDEALLSIRSQGTFTRLLVPLSRSEQTMWEVLNYGFALLGLIAVGVFWYMRRRNEEPTIPVEVSSERVEQE